MAERYCTECGALSGEQHVRNKLYLWRRKPRDLIETEEKKKQQIIALQRDLRYKPVVNNASGGGG